MAKMVLSLGLQVRSLQGTVYDCYLVPTDSEVTKLLLTQGKRYHDAVEARRLAQPVVPHPFGPPFVHLARALVAHLFAKADKLQPAHQQVVQELHHKARLEDGGAELSAEVVGCRLTKTYRSEMRRLLIATTSGATRRMFRESPCSSDRRLRGALPLAWPRHPLLFLLLASVASFLFQSLCHYGGAWPTFHIDAAVARCYMSLPLPQPMGA